MTEFSFSSYPQFSRDASTSRIANQLGKNIIEKTELVFNEDLEETICYYDSYDLATAFWQTASRNESINGLGSLTQPLLDRDNTSIEKYCQDIIDSINNHHYHDHDHETKQKLITSFSFLIAFGFLPQLATNRTFLSGLSYSVRRYSYKVTFAYKRLDNLNKIIEENFNSVSILLSSSNDNTCFGYYPAASFNNYTVDGLEVFSKIPESIALDFSYKLQVQQTHLYSEYEFVLPHPVCKLSAGNLGDIVFEEFAKEDYLTAMDSSDKIQAVCVKSPYKGSASFRKVLVRKKTLKKNCSIIPVISDCIALNPATLETYKIKLLRIRINAPHAKFLKYNKSKNFLSSLPAKFFSLEGLAWINPAAYVVKMKELFGNFSKHDPNFANLFLSSNIDVSTIRVNSNSLASTKISNSDFRYHEASSAITANSKLQDIQRVESSLKQLAKTNTEWAAKLNSHEQNVRRNESLINGFDERLEYFKRQIQDTQESKKTQTEENNKRVVEIAVLKTNMSAIKDTLADLQKQAASFQEVKHATVMEGADTLEVDWLKNIKSSNIDFHSCFYTLPALYANSSLVKKLILPTETPSLDSEVEQLSDEPSIHINIKDCPQLAYYAQEKMPIDPELIFGEDYQTILDSNHIPSEQLIPSLTYIYFSTIKPSIIKVDGSNTNQIVGGPYHVEVKAGFYFYNGPNQSASLSPTLTMKLKDESSVFGYLSKNNKSIHLWVHPHTRYFETTIDSHFYNSIMCYKTRGCLGEAQAPIYKAFQNSNVRSAVFAAKTWIESANSTDTWGRNYKKFPKVSDLNLDNSNTLETDSLQTESQEISDVEVSEMLQDLMDQVTNDQPTSQEAVMVDTPEIIVETVIPVQEDTEVEVTERINEFFGEAMQGIIGQTEPVVIESTPHDSPPPPAYTTYTEVVTSN